MAKAHESLATAPSRMHPRPCSRRLQSAAYHSRAAPSPLLAPTRAKSARAHRLRLCLLCPDA
eukprot:6191242-Pleurochrysis_carterae.AAC.1